MIRQRPKPVPDDDEDDVAPAFTPPGAPPLAEIIDRYESAWRAIHTPIVFVEHVPSTRAVKPSTPDEQIAAVKLAIGKIDLDGSVRTITGIRNRSRVEGKRILEITASLGITIVDDLSNRGGRPSNRNWTEEIPGAVQLLRAAGTPVSPASVTRILHADYTTVRDKMRAMGIATEPRLNAFNYAGLIPPAIQAIEARGERPTAWAVHRMIGGQPAKIREWMVRNGYYQEKEKTA